MKLFVSAKRVTILSTTLLGFGTLALSGVTSAVATPTNVAVSTSQQASANDQKHLATIISKGDQEIARRLTTLGTLTAKINAASKLSASDKTYLLNEVSTEVSNLTTLKAKLDAETTLAAARTDAQSIVSDYRVYALIVPKIQLIKTADDQLVTEGKLTALATKLQSRITAAKTAGKDVTALQTKLTDMTTQITNAQAISSSIETKVLALQPSDYNSNHTILSGDEAQLKTAHTDNLAAYNDAKSIVSLLKNL